MSLGRGLEAIQAQAFFCPRKEQDIADLVMLSSGFCAATLPHHRPHGRRAAAGLHHGDGVASRQRRQARAGGDADPAPRPGTFWKVTFLAVRPGIAVGGILAFASSFDELMLSLFLTGATTRTLPRLLWEQMSDFLERAVIAAAATLIVAFSMLLLLVAVVLERKFARPREVG